MLYDGFISSRQHDLGVGSMKPAGEMNYPNQIDDYLIISQIGKGAFGTVFEAQVGCNRVAIKALSKSIIKKHNLAHRVRNEVSIHFQLRHPNVLELFHFFEDGENVYLVMELAAEELYQRIKKVGKLGEGEVRKIFCAVVEGLAYLHSHGIIHRDLKLSNILLTERGIPKIADFGLAVKMDSRGDCEQQTLCGTPNYLAPEVILKNPYGRAADLWSLGCLLYTLVVGRPPFESNNVRDTFSKVSRGDFQIPNSVPHSARDLISKLIVLNPNERITLDEIRRHSFLKTNYYPSPPPVPLFHQTSSNQQSSDFALIPLCSLHLKSIKQTTKHGILQILEDHQLFIDFHREIHCYVISPDGMRVEVHSRPFFSPQSLLSTYSCSSSHLPSNITQIYEYGRRFVNLLRSKTPQAVLITNEFRAYLMDNEKEPFDFQIRYYNGDRLEYTPSSGNTQQILWRSSMGSVRLFDIFSNADPLIVNSMNVYNRCISNRPGLDPLQSFPVIIRENNTSTTTGIGDITAPQMTALVSSTMSTISPPSSYDPEKSFEYACKTFLPQIGWCLASVHQQFLLLFTDGRTLLIDGKTNRVAYAEDRGRIQSRWYRIDETLPVGLKEKLSYFPKFVQALRSGAGHTFIS